MPTDGSRQRETMPAQQLAGVANWGGRPTRERRKGGGQHADEPDAHSSGKSPRQGTNPRCRPTGVFDPHVLDSFGTGQRVPQVAHPGRGDGQRLPAGPRLQGHTQVQLGLPGSHPQPRRRLQRLQLGIIMGRADVLDVPRPAA